MTDDEKKELEELRAKESLSDNEVTRAAELERMEAEELPISEEDEFDQAFAEAIGKKPAVNDEDLTGDGDKKSSVKKEDQDQDNTGIFNGVPEDDDTTSKKDNTDDPDNPQTKIAQLEADLAKERQRTKSWEGRIEAANKRAKELEEKLKETSESGQGKKSPKDEEDDEVLSEFIEEFPSLEEPIRVLIKKEGSKIAREIVEAKLNEITPDIRKVVETSEEEAEAKHFQKIEDAHSDYLKIYESGALQTWIDNQPKFLQNGLNLIVEEGEADEIIEMLDSYKKAAKIVSVEPVNRKDKSKRKLKGLEAVESQSGGPPKSKKKTDKDDFDGAWDEALKS